MKLFLLPVALLTLTVSLAQKPLSNANCDIILTISSEEGNNGLAVVYNPKASVYYSVYAGNTTYPIEIHNLNGESIYSGEVGYDCRGMWYNPSKKCLEGISFNNEGGFEIVLEPNGNLGGTRTTDVSYGMESQTVGIYAEKVKSVMFVQGNTVYFFKKAGSDPKTLALNVDYTTYLNTNGPIYTGVKNYEIGLFNPETESIHLFSQKTGDQTAVVKLNTGSCNAGAEIPETFRISYANGRLFLYDTYMRTWTGYKLF